VLSSTNKLEEVVKLWPTTKEAGKDRGGGSKRQEKHERVGVITYKRLGKHERLGWYETKKTWKGEVIRDKENMKGWCDPPSWETTPPPPLLSVIFSGFKYFLM